jgi:hypothetical protein
MRRGLVCVTVVAILVTGCLDRAHEKKLNRAAAEFGRYVQSGISPSQFDAVQLGTSRESLLAALHLPRLPTNVPKRLRAARPVEQAATTAHCLHYADLAATRTTWFAFCFGPGDLLVDKHVSHRSIL